MQDNWPPAFTLDQKRILNLLTGDRFYSNQSAALREAILNSIDAVNRRIDIDSSIRPTILVNFNSDNLTLSISDNGVGMGEKQVNDLFTKVGASASNQELNTKSVGEFGIGVISYFMAANSFELHTFDGQTDPIGLKFNREMLSGGQAGKIDPELNTQGTLIKLNLIDVNVFNLLVEKYSYWCKDVSGLVATKIPENKIIPQGGQDKKAENVNVDHPIWVEKSHLSPVSEAVGWDAMTGASKVSVLYRGVFVQEYEVRGAWGIKGSIDVDPKNFKPRLNREGFVTGEFQSEVDKFLKEVHPKILESMADVISKEISNGKLNKWNQKRWASFWLSVPRTPQYANANNKWDQIFRGLPTFELAAGNKWEPINLNQLLAYKKDLYVAPLAEEKSSDLINSAVRLLRNTGKKVIRGIRKDNSWMRFSGAAFSTTADLITQVFTKELPPMIMVSNQAEKILSEVGKVVTLYTGPPAVEIVKIGSDGSPILKLNQRLIINVDNENARKIVMGALQENSGATSLLALSAQHAYEQLTQVAAIVKNIPNKKETLSPMRRKFIMDILR